MHSSDLNGACAVKLSLCIEVGLVRKFLGCIYAKVVFFAACPDLRLPAIVPSADAKEPRQVTDGCMALILRVSRACHHPQIYHSVVVPIAVYVVNLVFRPSSMQMKPYKSVRKMQPAIDLYLPVAVRVVSASGIANAYALMPSAPSKHPSLWVVVKQFAQARCGKIGLSHDTVPSLIGQRPACVDSTGGLRHFTTQACSGAPGITKHFYKAKASLAGFFTFLFLNPLGALTPFNAL